MAESNENSTLRKENDAPSTRLTETETLLYRHNFWDKEMRPHRQSLIAVLFVPLFLTTLLMWVCLSIYWGSLVPSSSSKPLTVTVTNLDVGGEFGAGVVAAIQIANQAKGNTIKWLFDSNIESVNDSRGQIVEEKTWGAVLITPNATAELENALRLGTNNYNPQNSILFLYASARNQITVNSHIVPPVLAVINPIIRQLAIQRTETFLQSIVNNTEALQTALKCPQCLASPFGMTSLDIVPFDVPEATGSTMVGLIFLLTFTFSIFQILRVTGLTIGGHLRLTSALIFRTISSLSTYLIMGLSYTLVNLAFGVPMSRRFGHGGFVIYWLLNTCTMGAVGLPMESLFTIIGLKWAGYFLSFWIIVNVSGAFSSFEIMPSFYQYGYAFPFYHSIQGARTIIFGTKNHLGTNFGVLITWTVVGLLGVYGGTAWRTHTNKKTAIHYLP
ncbi:Protein of unknown function (DUF3533) domain containing protein [Hyaloscypha variabilis]